MQRVCFVLKLREDRLEEYAARHTDVWPEMQDALRATGWRNYSLFLGPNAQLIGYVEVDDFDAAREGMKAFPVNERWQAEMLPFFDRRNAEGGVKADDAMQPLRELFHLD
jgi:L-rhamnose mutarotase